MLLRDLFRVAAKAANKVDFIKVMTKIKDINRDAHSWNSQTYHSHWSRHMFDESVKSNHVTNNLTESFNALLGDFRSKAILTFMENLKRKLMKRLLRRF